MGHREYLGEFEQVVLLALLRLRGPGYGAEIHEEILRTTGRDVSIPAVYVTLKRMERKGLVTSKVTQPPGGGRATRNYQVSPAGEDALAQSRLGTLGLVLACLGLYSLMAYQVATRRQELGIRKAVGATDSRLAWGVVGERIDNGRARRPHRPGRLVPAAPGEQQVRGRHGLWWIPRAPLRRRGRSRLLRYRKRSFRRCGRVESTPC